MKFAQTWLVQSKIVKHPCPPLHVFPANRHSAPPQSLPVSRKSLLPSLQNGTRIHIKCMKQCSWSHAYSPWQIPATQPEGGTRTSQSAVVLQHGPSLNIIQRMRGINKSKHLLTFSCAEVSENFSTDDGYYRTIRRREELRQYMYT